MKTKPGSKDGRGARRLPLTRLTFPLLCMVVAVVDWLDGNHMVMVVTYCLLLVTTTHDVSG